MKVTYNSPNRSHHYRYAKALAQAGCLHAFVSGFSRFSPHAELPGMPVVRADQIQNIYLAALRLRAPARVSEELAYLSKLWLDRKSSLPARESDLFLFYSGAGLRTLGDLRGSSTLGVVEAVNGHVLAQQRIMREEFERLGLPLTGFPAREVARRVKEYELADAVLCPSGFVKASFVAEGIPAERVHVVPYGISQPEIAMAGPALRDDETFRVLYVGQLTPRKGVRYLLEAFALFRHPKKELLIVGPRSDPSGLEGATVPEHVRFAGVLKGEALARAYREASVFVLPTLEEGLALVLGEALAHGTPVITTVNSGGANLFQDGEEGFLTPIRDPGALAARMQLLADDPALRERMSQAALARGSALGGWDATERELVETLRGLAANGRRMKLTPTNA
jgi:glycosyltransferase involved in cell wall biosynthesis